ncbi:ATP-binding cassette domain-containing protein [Maribacter sp. MJ134]|nr:ATP-binding cassette domain-containing protein [Maribacter sp. MJ134]
MKKHCAVLIDNKSQKKGLIHAILRNEQSFFKFLGTKKGTLFSPVMLSQLIDEEERHNHKIIHQKQPLRTMSSGEQKKALLRHILESKPDYIILDNPFDSLDHSFQKELKNLLLEVSGDFIFIQLVSRVTDILPFINQFTKLNGDRLESIGEMPTVIKPQSDFLNGKIPAAIVPIRMDNELLIAFKNVSVSYEDKAILNNINWTVKKGEFWQLIGNNGSGKSTLLSMITGDNPKAYGQNILLFGKRKGTGESVWDIKQKLGYFSPVMTYKFSGRFTIEQMLISGFNDSIGLYTKPTEVQKRKAKEWLQLLNLWPEKDMLFADSSLGQKRLIMTVRAMVKHPPLLILDEPTTGMDDEAAALLVALVNKIAKETDTAIIYVSHRNETGLQPQYTYQLHMSPKGSIGVIKK